jgi:hypothetical protein
LSQQEGIPEDQWCYETNARKLLQEQASVMASLFAPQHVLARAAEARYLFSRLDQQPQVTALKKNYLRSAWPSAKWTAATGPLVHLNAGSYDGRGTSAASFGARAGRGGPGRALGALRGIPVAAWQENLPNKVQATLEEALNRGLPRVLPRQHLFQ